MSKITFIGAGSLGFTRNLARDLLSFPAFHGGEICLMDINEERLSWIAKAVEKLVATANTATRVTATTDRAKALKNADGVVITIRAGGLSVWRHDTEIPMKYGVDINVGDTRGPAGIFRFLRTAPVMLDICRDVERYCPDALVLNYTNPMAMLCRLMQEESGLRVTGLCHSVQETAGMLADWIGARHEEITYLCAGINHQAWFLSFNWKGRDAYPALREAITSRADIYAQEIVRNEMFLHLDYYVSESSGHSSEYNAWFRKRPDLIERYCAHGTGWNPGVHAFAVKRYEARERTWEEEIRTWLDKEVDLRRGNEYAAHIFNAVFGDATMFEFNGNVRNFGLIDNLPGGCCVEVPVVASRAGLRAMHVGRMPEHLAILNGINAGIEELVVHAGLEGDARAVYQAICMDPLTSAVLSLAEIETMVKEMFEKNRDFLPQFRKGGGVGP